MLSSISPVTSFSQTLFRMFSIMKFSKTHEWVKLDGDVATIGVSDHAQRELGDIVFIELPKPSTKIAKGGVISTIETDKTVANVFSPLEGTVIEANQQLNKNQTLLNKSPKGDGWIAKIKVNKSTAEQELEKLMTEEEYKKLL